MHTNIQNLIKEKLKSGCYSFLKIWVFAGLTHILLYSINPNSIWNSDIPLGLKFRFISSEAILASSAFLLMSAIIAIIPTRHTRIRLLFVITISILYASFLVVSWGQSILTKHFLTIDSLLMLLNNPIEMYEHTIHFHPTSTIIAIIAIVFGSTVIYFAHKPTHFVSKYILTFGIFFALTTNLLFYWYSIPIQQLPFVNTNPYDDPIAGKISSIGDHLTQLFLNNTGPHLSIIGSNHFRNVGEIDRLNGYYATWKNQVTIDKYLSEINLQAIDKPNVILILIESLREGIIQPVDDPSSVMPNLNKIALESILFSRHYTTSSHSNYSDLSALSSHFPLRSPNTHIYPANPTYPRVLIYDILKELGYRTSIVSSQNENWGKMINYINTSGLDNLLHSENFHGIIRPDMDENARFWKNQRSGKVDDFDTVNRAINWIGKDLSCPFFMYMNLQNSHFPFDIGPGFSRRFGNETLSFEPSFVFGTPEQAPELFGRYLDSLAYIDVQLGRLFEWMKTSDLMDKTIVVVTGDTGQAFLEHGVFGHANKLFDEVLRTPLLLRIPNAPHRMDGRLAQNIDIPPTILGLIGLPPHPSFQGIDLLNEKEDPERSVFLVAQSPFAKEYAMVKGPWKIVIQVFPREYRLYNLINDPSENHNLASEYSSVVEQLKPELHAWYNFQIDYYRDITLHSRFYPPIVSREN